MNLIQLSHRNFFLSRGEKINRIGGLIKNDFRESDTFFYFFLKKRLSLFYLQHLLRRSHIYLIQFNLI